MTGGNVTEKLTAIIYSDCSQECERMSSLLQALDGEFHEYLLGVDFSDRQFRMEFGSEATYPQVAIGNKHIGGMKESLQYMKDQGLF
jgi:glutaredoxin